MVDNINSPEKERLTPNRSPEKRDDVGRHNEKLREHSKELAHGIEGVVEGVEDSEGMSTGEVAESSSENKKKTSGSVGGAVSTSQTSQKKEEEPPFEVMVIQLKTQLKKEIATLQREAKKFKKGSNFSPYHLSQIMQKIRRLREILAELVTAAGEKVKTLWREYAKGK